MHLVEAIGLHPEPPGRKGSAPILFGICGCIVERVLLAVELDPARGTTVRHQRLPVGLKHRQTGKPASSSALRLTRRSPAVHWCDVDIPAAFMRRASGANTSGAVVGNNATSSVARRLLEALKGGRVHKLDESREGELAS